MEEQLTDILANAWSRSASAAEMVPIVEGRVDSTQGDSDFERPACKEVDDASLPFRLWYKVKDNDPLSVSIEERESVGLAGRLIGQELCDFDNYNIPLQRHAWDQLFAFSDPTTSSWMPDGTCPEVPQMNETADFAGVLNHLISANHDSPEQFQNLGMLVPGAAHSEASTSNFPLGNIDPSYPPGSESDTPGLSASFLEDSVSVFFPVNTDTINEGTGISMPQYSTMYLKELPNWAPEDHPIQLWSESKSELVIVQTQLDDGMFRKKFYAKVTTIRAYFLEHAFKAVQYIVIDHLELNPPWSGIICSWDQQDGIVVHHTQVLVRWDPRYGFPLTHKYILKSDIIASGASPPKSDSNICAKDAWLKRMRAIHAQLLDFFERIDNFNVTSVGHEDCMKAQKGKAAMQQRIEHSITQFPCNSNMYKL
ncbi:hypothetical protein SCLCIDRAFT_9346 [Scleroderma citrinum Foug A]|uniref:Uncharacterized protein n=1 Tax=Scleroderma citrinum Foug A TaxID=1036808 RepID=A0A0C3E116_9AGAM|nr:hypothetical protein SCLCIDRAFT_9346 [Scleroderma citrinum Foug A]